MSWALSLLLCFFLAACSGQLPTPLKEKEAVTRPAFEKGTFQDLSGWHQDRHDEALGAFLRSCDTLLKQPVDKPFKPFGVVGDFHAPCRQAKMLQIGNTIAARQFFETYFTPYAVSDAVDDNPEGLFTGYYEASLDGSKTRKGPYQTPLYGEPRDLYTADLGLWYSELAGKNITVQVKDGKLLRYPARAAIEKNGVNAEVIAWVDDPVDAFFLQIQGSGLVRLDDGSQMRVGYAGKNGHEYFAIGRALIERGALTKENVSMQSIRTWLSANPSEAASLMNLNPSYVFFRTLDTSGPVGAQGVVLTPMRSLAVDKNLYSYGIPVWLQAAPPETGTSALSTLLIAQDTGGAIRGAVRGDVFWGYGAKAENMAGVMKSKGRYWFLMPKISRL